MKDSSSAYGMTQPDIFKYALGAALGLPLLYYLILPILWNMITQSIQRIYNTVSLVVDTMIYIIQWPISLLFVHNNVSGNASPENKVNKDDQAGSPMTSDSDKNNNNNNNTTNDSQVSNGHSTHRLAMHKFIRVVVSLSLLWLIFVVDQRGLIAKWFEMECTPKCQALDLLFFNDEKQSSSSSLPMTIEGSSPQDKINLLKNGSSSLLSKQSSTLEENSNAHWRISLRTLCDRHSFSDLVIPLEMKIENLRFTQLLPAGSKVRIKQAGYFNDQILYTLPTDIQPKKHITVTTSLVQQKCLTFDCNYAKNFPSNFTIEILEATSTGEVHLQYDVLLYNQFSFPPQSFKGDILAAHQCNNRLRKRIQIFGWNKARKTSCAVLSAAAVTGVTPLLGIRGTNDHVTLGPQHVSIELGFGRSMVIIDNKGDAEGEVDDEIRAMLLEGKVPDRYNMTDPKKMEQLRNQYSNILNTQFDDAYLAQNYHDFTDAALYLITVANAKDDSIIHEMQKWIHLMLERYQIKPLVLLSDCENHSGIDTFRNNLMQKIGNEVQCVSLVDFVNLKKVKPEKSFALISLLSQALKLSCLKRSPFDTVHTLKSMRSTKHDSLCVINNLTGGWNFESAAAFRRDMCDKFKKANLWFQPIIPLFVSDFLLLSYAGLC